MSLLSTPVFPNVILVVVAGNMGLNKVSLPCGLIQSPEEGRRTNGQL